MPQLSGFQIQQLQEALLDAFPSSAVLDQMVRLNLDQNLDAIAGGDNLTDVTFNLIVWSARNGRLHHLWDAASDANPNNPKLQQVITKLKADLGRLEDGIPLELPDVPEPPAPIPRWLVYGGGALLLVIAGLVYYGIEQSRLQGQGAQDSLGDVAEILARTPTPTVSSTPTPTPTPIRMNGPRFNIAVANFDESSLGNDVPDNDVPGSDVPDNDVPESDEPASDVGERLSRLLFNGLNEQVNDPSVLASLPRISKGDILVWHLADVLDPARLDSPTIVGESTSDRSALAESVARQINADMVIYGNLRKADDPSTLALEFYFDSPQLQEQPDAMGGPSQLARPFAFRGRDGDEVVSDLGDELRLSTNILYWLTVGMTHAIQDDEEGALALFLAGEEALDGWGEAEGKELLYYLIGRSALYLRDYPLAEAYFDKSLALDENYANALIGLGSIHLDRAQLFNVRNRSLPEGTQQCLDDDVFDKIFGELDDEQTVEQAAQKAQADVAMAVELFQQAIIAAGPGDWPPLLGIAQLDLGLAYALRGQFSIAEQDDTEDQIRTIDRAAVNDFDLAISTITDAQAIFRSADQVELDGHAAWGLGTTRFALANRLGRLGESDARNEAAREALSSLNHCITLADDERTTRWYFDRVVSCGCEPYLEEVKEMLKSGGADG